MFCEQTERVVTVCGCSDGADCVGERMEGRAALLKQTSRPTGELVGQVSEYVAWGLKEFLAGLEGRRVMRLCSMIELWTRQAVLSPLVGGSRRTNSGCCGLWPQRASGLKFSFYLWQDRDVLQGGSRLYMNNSCDNYLSWRLCTHSMFFVLSTYSFLVSVHKAQVHF